MILFTKMIYEQKMNDGDGRKKHEKEIKLNQRKIPRLVTLPIPTTMI